MQLGDVAPTGEVRLDAVARYLQDIANDDSADAGLPDAMAWVVRRLVIVMARPASFREQLRLRTFCSGTGPSWAERRTRIVGERGAHLEAAAVWVSVDPASGAPRRLTEAFHAIFGESAAGRRVRARLELSDPTEAAATRPFPVRAVDFDLFGHVNNAAYWTAVEEERRHHEQLRHSVEVRLEHRGPIVSSQRVELVVARAEPRVNLWLTADGTTAAAVVMAPFAS